MEGPKSVIDPHVIDPGCGQMNHLTGPEMFDRSRDRAMSKEESTETTHVERLSNG